MSAVRAWWRDREPRERLLLGVLGGLLAATMLWLGIVKPLFTARAETRTEIATLERLNARLRSAPAAGQGPAQLSGPPATIVQTAAAQAGVTIARSEADGARTRAIVEAAPFPAVMQWLAALDAQAGVAVAETRIARGAAAGMVSVTLVFR
ncbi:type II secretion system protein GspM [Sphingomonas flavalba]|uniref:type II secretion system protein GspM n=1 Tax=Sphingomonas flavalba TaxID=2559804 RepID=UPI00109DD2FE|nr:type II secretion system protein GspM [Sphingomonas flavalba]